MLYTGTWHESGMQACTILSIFQILLALPLLSADQWIAAGVHLDTVGGIPRILDLGLFMYGSR